VLEVSVGLPCWIWAVRAITTLEENQGDGRNEAGFFMYEGVNPVFLRTIVPNHRVRLQFYE
jgi:hypothetical protein